MSKQQPCKKPKGLISYLMNNTKRLTSVVVVALFFVMCNSFSQPGADAPAVSKEGAPPQTPALETTVQPQTVMADEAVVIEEDDLTTDGYVDPEGAGVDGYTLDDILDEQKDIIPKTDGADGGTDELEQLSKDDWRLIVVNKQHSIPEDYDFVLGTIKGNMMCDERIIEDLLLMLQAAKDDGVSLVICSPYRDESRQETLFGQKIRNYMKKGMSYMAAYSKAAQSVTLPGSSEHQIGLALDIVSKNHYSLNEEFGETSAGQWLAAHSCEYGFILRYPKGKEYITGIEYEPWHFRYVGVTAATAMTKQGLALEEFVERLD